MLNAHYCYSIFNIFHLVVLGTAEKIDHNDPLQKDKMYWLKEHSSI